MLYSIKDLIEKPVWGIKRGDMYKLLVAKSLTVVYLQRFLWTLRIKDILTNRITHRRTKGPPRLNLISSIYYELEKSLKFFRFY